MLTPASLTVPSCCPVLELRQYTLHPGKRDVLIDLFEREFIEPQEALGMWLVGQFRDLDRPDRFVWIRGFADMPSREAALKAFYGGPVWKAHREAANATMIDSSNVMLLRPTQPSTGFSSEGPPRPPAGATERSPATFTATILFVQDASAATFARRFAEEVLPGLHAAGATPLAVLETEHADNTFPALPVRTGENAFVWFERHPTVPATTAEERLSSLRPNLIREPERLRLQPTARSRLQ